LLGWPAAIAVGKGVGCPRQVVLDPLGIGGERVRVEAEQAALDVDARPAVALELLAEGGVVQMGVGSGHLRAGMAEQALDHVLGDALVDEPCAKAMP
jgi:hypothetical protein